MDVDANDNANAVANEFEGCGFEFSEIVCVCDSVCVHVYDHVHAGISWLEAAT